MKVGSELMEVKALLDSDQGRGEVTSITCIYLIQGFLENFFVNFFCLDSILE